MKVEGGPQTGLCVLRDQTLQWEEEIARHHLFYCVTILIDLNRPVLKNRPAGQREKSEKIYTNTICLTPDPDKIWILGTIESYSKVLLPYQYRFPYITCQG